MVSFPNEDSHRYRCSGNCWAYRSDPMTRRVKARPAAPDRFESFGRTGRALTRSVRTVRISAARPDGRVIGPRRILFPGSCLSYTSRQTPGTEEEVVVIIGIAIAGGLVLLCTCMFVVRRKRAGRD